MRCPSCGLVNPPSATECETCGFPLGAEAIEPQAAELAQEPAEPAAGPPTPEPASTPPPPPIQRPLRFRPRPRRVDPTSATLWIVFGGFAASVVLWVAVQATLKKAGPPPIPGATSPVQAMADSLVGILDRDSTNVEAHQKLADVYYDTGNWDPAIVQYRAVLRLDPSRTTAMVDLGVCYFNLSDAQTAEMLFNEALRREPDHSVALFNLGIVHEQRKEFAQALSYFRRCLDSNPPPMMRQPVSASIERVQMKMKGAQ